MCDKRKIAEAAADWFVMKLPPWVSPARREMWKEMVADTVYCALLTQEGLQEDAPKMLRTFCVGCARSLRFKEKLAGRLVACPACGRKQPLRFGRN